MSLRAAACRSSSGAEISIEQSGASTSQRPSILRVSGLHPLGNVIRPEPFEHTWNAAHRRPTRAAMAFAQARVS
jgi:hypothetical protein